jgi:hypothetical protein
MLRGWGAGRNVVVVALAGALATFVLVGSAAGHSPKPTLSVVLRPLIGTNANGVQQVTYGSKIGFHLEVTNNGRWKVEDVDIVVKSDTATFSDASRSECGADPRSSRRMVCRLGYLRGGSTFSVDLRFTAPSSGIQVVTTPSATIDEDDDHDEHRDADHHGDDDETFVGDPVKTTLISSAGGSLIDTYLVKSESASTADSLPQHSDFEMPDSLLGGHFGVATSVQETTGTPLCSKCPRYVTVLTIPASVQANSPFSPTNPFTFKVTLLPAGIPYGYKPTGLYHDGVKIPKCSYSPLNGTTHICLTSFESSRPAHGNEHGSGAIVATGKADQNGRIGFG